MVRKFAAPEHLRRAREDARQRRGRSPAARAKFPYRIVQAFDGGPGLHRGKMLRHGDLCARRGSSGSRYLAARTARISRPAAPTSATAPSPARSPSSYKFSNSSTDFYLAYGISHLKKITDPKATVLITDENVYNAHTKRFKGWNTIVLKPGEEYKVQATVDAVIEKLIEMEADRKTTLVGVGGGVITDITGYVASVYMRGLRFGFVPTSIIGNGRCFYRRQEWN